MEWPAVMLQSLLLFRASLGLLQWLALLLDLQACCLCVASVLCLHLCWPRLAQLVMLQSLLLFRASLGMLQWLALLVDLQACCLCVASVLWWASLGLRQWLALLLDLEACCLCVASVLCFRLCWPRPACSTGDASVAVAFSSSTGDAAVARSAS